MLLHGILSNLMNLEMLSAIGSIKRYAKTIVKDGCQDISKCSKYALKLDKSVKWNTLFAGVAWKMGCEL